MAVKYYGKHASADPHVRRAHLDAEERTHVSIGTAWICRPECTEHWHGGKHAHTTLDRIAAHWSLRPAQEMPDHHGGADR